MVAVHAVAILAGLLLASVVLAFSGKSPGDSLSTFLDGGFGSSFSLNQAIANGVPLALAGLGVAIPLRLRLWNVGAEGQFFMGAVGATWVALTFSDQPSSFVLPAMVIASMIAGGLWALLAAAPRAMWGVNEIVTTLLLNYVAILATSYLLIGAWRSSESSFPVTDLFSDSARLPIIAGSSIHLGVLFPIVAAAMLVFLLHRTTWGYEVRLIGANATMAKLMGLSPGRKIITAMAIGGALAGIAGMIEVSVTFGRLTQSISPGYGFMAVVIAALVAASVPGTIVTAFVFGGFVAGGLALQTNGVPQAFVPMLLGITLFCAIAGERVSERVVHRRLRTRAATAATATLTEQEPS